MLGDHKRKEPIFYYVRMEEIVPEDHLLRLVDKHIDFSFIRNKVKQLYSHTGRPSIDPNEHDCSSGSKLKLESST